MAEDNPNGHVNFLTFGMDQLDKREPLYRLITNTRRMDGITATLALRELYETQYGIFNHDDPTLVKQHPLALMELHPAEDSYSYSMERRYRFRFREYEIQKHWGCSYKEFLELPFDLAEDIFRIEQLLAVERNRRLEAQARRERELDQASRGR